MSHKNSFNATKPRSMSVPQFKDLEKLKQAPAPLLQENPNAANQPADVQTPPVQPDQSNLTVSTQPTVPAQETGNAPPLAVNQQLLDNTAPAMAPEKLNTDVSPAVLPAPGDGGQSVSNGQDPVNIPVTATHVSPPQPVVTTPTGPVSNTAHLPQNTAPVVSHSPYPVHQPYYSPVPNHTVMPIHPPTVKPDTSRDHQLALQVQIDESVQDLKFFKSIEKRLSDVIKQYGDPDGKIEKTLNVARNQSAAMALQCQEYQSDYQKQYGNGTDLLQEPVKKLAELGTGKKSSLETQREPKHNNMQKGVVRTQYEGGNKGLRKRFNDELSSSQELGGAAFGDSSGFDGGQGWLHNNGKQHAPSNDSSILAPNAKKKGNKLANVKKFFSHKNHSQSEKPGDPDWQHEMLANDAGEDSQDEDLSLKGTASVQTFHIDKQLPSNDDEDKSQDNSLDVLMEELLRPGPVVPKAPANVDSSIPSLIETSKGSN